MSERKKVCNTCGGSGEIGFFQGESRFFITREECPACCGFGYVMDEDQANGGGDEPDINGDDHERHRDQH